MQADPDSFLMCIWLLRLTFLYHLVLSILISEIQVRYRPVRAVSGCVVIQLFSNDVLIETEPVVLLLLAMHILKTKGYISKLEIYSLGDLRY